MTMHIDNYFAISAILGYQFGYYINSLSEWLSKTPTHHISCLIVLVFIYLLS